jgi:hypothetical protein
VLHGRPLFDVGGSNAPSTFSPPAALLIRMRASCSAPSSTATQSRE